MPNEPDNKCVWRDPSTAPKDGTMVLLWTSSGIVSAWFCNEPPSNDAKDNGSYDWVCYDDAFLIDGHEDGCILGWMPCPDMTEQPPQSETTNEQRLNSFIKHREDIGLPVSPECLTATKRCLEVLKDEDVDFSNYPGFSRPPGLRLRWGTGELSTFALINHHGIVLHAHANDSNRTCGLYDCSNTSVQH